MQLIQSVKNPSVLKMRALKEGRVRGETGRMLVEGDKMVEEAMASGLEIECVFVRTGREEALSAILEAARARGAQLFGAPQHVLEAVSDTKTPQGIAAMVAIPQGLSLEAYARRIVALDGVQDPGNVGTIWRTADAAGVEGMLLSKDSADPFSPKVVRATMGSVFRVPVAREEGFLEALYAFQRRGWQIVASAPGGAPLARQKVCENWVLVVGSESRGVSQAVLEMADARLSLPMRGGAESLNAAVAAGIMMYDLTREAAI